MKYYRITYGTRYCGTEDEEYVTFSDTATEEDVEEYAMELARQNGESYEYLETGWDGTFEDEDDEESYYEDCWYQIEEVTEEDYIEWRESI